MTDSLAADLNELARLVRKRFATEARTTGVSHAGWRVLALLSRRPGLTQAQIAERIEAQPIAVSRMLDGLVEAGLVERRPDPSDRRVWHIHATAAAEPLVARLRIAADDLNGRILDGVSDAEKDFVRRMLSRFRANLIDVANDAGAGLR